MAKGSGGGGRAPRSTADALPGVGTGVNLDRMQSNLMQDREMAARRVGLAERAVDEVRDLDEIDTATLRNRIADYQAAVRAYNDIDSRLKAVKASISTRDLAALNAAKAQNRIALAQARFELSAQRASGASKVFIDPLQRRVDRLYAERDEIGQKIESLMRARFEESD